MDQPNPMPPVPPTTEPTEPGGTVAVKTATHLQTSVAYFLGTFAVSSLMYAVMFVQGFDVKILG